MEEQLLWDLIRKSNAGDEVARSRLVEKTYDAMRRIARKRMAGQSPDHTLQPSALVNEAYIRLFRDGAPQFSGHAHFFRAAAQAMRHVLIDHARRRDSSKRPPRERRVPLDALVDSYEQAGCGLVELDDALCRLGVQAPDLVELIELRYFCGLTLDEVAEVQQTSRSSVVRAWGFARAWLHKELELD